MNRARVMMLAWIGLASVAQAQNTAFTYQGHLKSNGQVVSGYQAMTFTVYDDPTLSIGHQVGNPMAANVNVVGGLFSIVLEFNPGSFNGGRRWLEISVNGTKLTPRQEIMPAPYALFAYGAPWSGIVGAPGSFPASGPAGGDLSGAYPNPTIGANAVNSGKLAADAASIGKLTGGAISCSGAKVGIGVAAPVAKLDSRASSGADGVYGLTGASSGLTDDVYVGVWGDSNNGDGVMGTTSLVQGYGVFGQASATTGNGVVGIAIASTGQNAGVIGATNSPQGFGGYFLGNVGIEGTLSKGGGSFKIDHPLDPANKYLYHSFVESPDMMNIYNGIVTTDAKGYATIVMPDWFEALNRDFRYQLTVIDPSDSPDFVQAKVVRELRSNRFVLRTSKPNTKVSWQVTGIRHDPFANAHRIPVEEDKSPSERGLYLYPKEQGISVGQAVGATRLRNSGGATTVR